MRTAEEWATDMGSFHGTDQENVSMKDRVKAIQLDAYKAGMSEAAKICITQQNFELDQTDRVVTHNGTCKQVKYAILTARDNKTSV